MAKDQEEHNNRIITSDKVPFKATFNGQPMDWQDLVTINQFYEASCTAEYVMERYGLDGKTAMELGAEARRQMDKYGYDEEEAIGEAATDLGIELQEAER